MAKVISEYTNEAGEIIKVYESGAEFNTARGRLVKPAAGTVIRTAAKATEYNRRRREKAAAELRRRIRQAAADGMPPGTVVRHSADAFAAAGAMLFEEVVMNSDAYPRDRLETLDKLGKWTGIIEDPKTAKIEDPNAARLTAAAAGLTAQAAAVLARVLGDVQAAQAVNRDKVVDVRAADAEDGTPRGG